MKHGKTTTIEQQLREHNQITGQIGHRNSATSERVEE